MKFSPEFIEKVRDANNIVDIIGQYTAFKHMGHNLMALCPFPDHREKSPSFSVSEPKQVYYCFGCKKSGNVITFLTEYNGMSFVDAIEFLANRASIAIPTETFEQKQKKSDKEVLTKINLLAGSFYKAELARLPVDHPAKVYLEKRGLTQEIIEKFKIGYAPEGWNHLSDFLKVKNAPLHLGQKLGLIKAKPGKSEFFDIFRNRIMYPILSSKGDVVGFGGRTIANENPKYLNSPESELFHKGKTLYGLNESSKYIRTEDQVIVVEGYMDLLALYQFGFKNVVATLGTALTVDHAKTLKRYSKNIVVLFDSDQAGQFAQERSLPILLGEELLPKAISLDDSKDPDEFLQTHGTEKLKEKLKSATDLFFVILQRQFKGYNATPTEKVQILEQISPFIFSVVNRNLRDLYVQEVAERLNVTLEWVQKGFQKLYQDNKKYEGTRPVEILKVQQNQNVIEEKIKIINPPKEEVFLVNLALFKEECMEELIGLDLESQLTNPGLQGVFKIAAKEYRQNPNDFAKLTSTLCSQVEDLSVITKHLDSDWDTKYDIQKLKMDCLQRVRERFLKLKAASIMQDLRAQGSVQTSPEKLEQFMNIIRNRQSLNKLKD